MTKSTVVSKLDDQWYAAIGQLYSATRGINFLIRNLLANPQIRILISLGITEADRASGSIQCLTDFFKHGVTPGISDTGRQCWIINSEVKGYLDINIPWEVLNDLRTKVGHFPAVSIASVGELACGFYTNYSELEPWAEPREYPMTLPSSDIKPGSPYGHRVEGATVAECWPKILHRIRTNGHLRPTGYDGQIQELIDLVTVVHEPPGLYFPEPNYLPIDKAYMDTYLPQVLEDSEVRDGVKYTYGQRIRSWFNRDQVADVVAKLKGELDSASAVINLWDAKWDNTHSGSPCLNHIWLRVLEGSLSMTATLRSNDMFSAWPANAMALRILQQTIATQVDPDLHLGPLVTISQSAHIYDDTFESADQVIANHYKGHKVTYDDPVGNFIIERVGGAVEVLHMHPGGEVVHHYKGKAALPMLRQIVSDNPTIQPAHAAYLGLEMGRACAINLPYTQDKPYG